MPDLNVTFAGLPLAGPIVVEARGRDFTIAAARGATEAGAGALIMPSLDNARMTRRADAAELTDNNVDDTATRQSERVIRRLNIDAYLDHIELIASKVEVPIIAPLESAHRSQWVPLAQDLLAAGAAAVELRLSIEEMSRNSRSDQIEKTIIRTTSAVAERVDAPVIVRIPATTFGLVSLVQNLGDCGAAGVLLRPSSFMSGIDAERVKITDAEDDEDASVGSFLAVTAGCRMLYRRVSPHIALQLPPHGRETLVQALLAGASLGTFPITGKKNERTSQMISQMQMYLESWMGRHSVSDLFEMRGLLSESRLSNSLENRSA